MQGLETYCALLRRAVVTAVASRSKEKAEAFIRDNPGLAGATPFGSYDELLADESVDAIYLPLPAGLHVDWVKKAAAAGKHVLCEKPISLVRGEPLSPGHVSYYIHTWIVKCLCFEVQDWLREHEYALLLASLRGWANSLLWNCQRVCVIHSYIRAMSAWGNGEIGILGVAALSHNAD